MKRVLILTCVALMALGLAGSAETWDDGVLEAEFCIDRDIIIGGETNFTWPENSDVGKADAIGTFWSEALQLWVTSNVEVELTATLVGEKGTLSFAPHYFTGSEPADTPLPTFLRIGATGNGEDTVTFPSVQRGSEVALEDLYIGVERSGYADHAGNYLAYVRVYVSWFQP